MRIEEGIKLDYSDVLIRPKRSELTSRSQVNLERSFKFKYSEREWTGIPIISANMTTVSTFEAGFVLADNNMLCCLHKFYNEADYKRANPEAWINWMNFIPSIGVSEEETVRIKELWNNTFPFQFLCIDIANGYTPLLVNKVKELRDYFEDRVVLIAGNVVSREMTEELILAGADVVKVGIGPSGLCKTRIITGVGIPQLSAVVSCGDAAHGLGGHIIADGGCTCVGDINKSLISGADFVMSGGMLAGHDESGGDIITKYKKTGYLSSRIGGNESEEVIEEKYKLAYGMSSDTAQKNHYGEQKDYRASEGRTVLVPYRGLLQNTLNEITGGLRSCATYIGAKNIKDFPKCGSFIRVSNGNQYNKVFEK